MGGTLLSVALSPYSQHNVLVLPVIESSPNHLCVYTNHFPLWTSISNKALTHSLALIYESTEECRGGSDWSYPTENP